MPSRPPKQSLSLSHPDLDWRGDTPVSRAFEDIYYAPLGSGLDECRHVFIEASGIRKGWADRSHIVIGETGFGTGLNFLALWQALKREKSSARIHYISTEQFPLKKTDLRRALGAYPEIQPFAQALIEQWPPPYPGLHQLSFAGGQIHLLLAFGDAATMLDRIEARVDFWFLDGFSPAHNPDMWSDALFAALARKSRQGARLATFTAAGHVRRGLTVHGFVMEKYPGFAGKREQLVGSFAGTDNDNEQEIPAGRDAPWYTMLHPSGGPVAVIGSGIAAATTVQACREVGLETIQIGCQPTSPLPIAILAPRLNLGANAPARLQMQALLNAWRFYNALECWEEPRGVLQPLFSSEEINRAEKAVAALNWSPDLLEFLAIAKTSAIGGTSLSHQALFWPKAGAVRPDAVYDRLSRADHKITAHAEKVIRNGKTWLILDKDGNGLCNTASVVIAAGPMSANFLKNAAADMSYRRGQISFVEPGKLPTRILSGNGFITPTMNTAFGEARIAGSSFHPVNDPHGTASALSTADDSDNLKMAQRLLGDDTMLHHMGSWAGLRVATQDHLPLAGPVADDRWFEETYAPARLDRKRTDLPPAKFREGLYVFTGLGARGFQTAPLIAKSLAAQIAGTPNPIEQKQRHALSPARFIMRRIFRASCARLHR